MVYIPLSGIQLSGTVYDQNNRPKAGVTVTLSRIAVSAATDSSGMWTMSLPPTVLYFRNRSAMKGVTELLQTGTKMRVSLSAPEELRIVVTDLKGAILAGFHRKLPAGIHWIELNTPTASKLALLRVRFTGCEVIVPAIDGLPVRFSKNIAGSPIMVPQQNAVLNTTDILTYSWNGAVLATDEITPAKDTSGIVRFLTIPPAEGIPWNDSLHYGVLIDVRDQVVYRTVTIGTQIWMAQNLNYGFPINGETNQNGINAEKYCYKDRAAMCDTFGGLYQWATAMALLDSGYNRQSSSDQVEEHHMGICPAGWHIPTTGEWSILKKYVDEFAGNDSMSAQILKSTENWATDMGWGPGTDDLGFRALAGGGRYYEGYNSKSTGGESWFRWCCRFRGVFWTASEKNDSTAYYEDISDDKTNLTRMDAAKTYGFCVRCVKD